MKPSIPFYKYLISYLIDMPVETSSSAYHPYLEIALSSGKLQLNTTHANYSYGSLHRVFRKAFDYTHIRKKKIRNVLLLGFGGGSVADILLNEYGSDAFIVAVEQDEEIIRLGKKYFGTGHLPNMELVHDDALHYVTEEKNEYDMVVVDLFRELEVPDQFARMDFLKKLETLLSPGGILFYNTIVMNREQKQQSEGVSRVLKELLPKTEEFVTDMNRVLIAGK